MKTKHYISVSQFVAANATDILEKRQKLLKENSYRLTAKRAKMSYSDLLWLVLGYTGYRIKTDHKNLIEYAYLLQAGIDPSTGVNIGKNMLYVKI